MSETRDARKQEILSALSGVALEEGRRDILESGLVENVAHCDGAVKVSLALPYEPGKADTERLDSAVRRALAALPWVSAVNVSVSRGITAMGRSKSGTPEAPVRNILAVASGKGGVGKSTVAVNLAAALRRGGASVGLLDADIYGPSIPTMLGAKGGKPSPVEGEDGRRLFGPVEAHGIRMMSMGFLVEEDRPVIWRGPMLHSALKQFFGDVAWGDLDYLVVDLPPGTGDVALTMAQSIDLAGAVVVSTPQEVARVDARKAVRMFEETGIPLLGLVENMTGEIFGRGAVREWAKAGGLPFLGEIPLAASIRESGDAGVPAALSQDEAAAGPFLRLGKEVALRIAEVNHRKSSEAPVSIELG